MQKHVEGIQTALEMMQEEASALLNQIRIEGADAYREGEDEAFRELDRHYRAVSAFVEECEALAERWNELKAIESQKQEPEENAPDEDRRSRRIEVKGRVSSDDVVSQNEYYMPLLEVLEEMGGSGRRRDVLDKIRDRMSHRFRAQDRKLVGDATEERWRNMASWSRKRLVEAGLLRDDSKKGTWELSEDGRHAVATKSEEELQRMVNDAT